MRLVDCDPKWIDFGERRGVGIRFLLPAGPWRSTGVRLLFANPLDGGPPLTATEAASTGIRCDNGGNRWERYGDDFTTLTISPSINFGSGGWHGNVSNGQVDGRLEP